MTDHKALAEEEDREWNALTPDERLRWKDRRNYWVSKGRKKFEVEMRSRIFLAQSQELWDEVAKGLSLHSAATLVKEARFAKRSIPAQIEVWKSQTYKCTTADGRVFRRKLTGKVRERVQANEADDWRGIRKFIRQKINDMLAGEHEVIRKRYEDDAMGQIKQVFTDLQERLRRASSRTLVRRQIVEACHVLGMDPPKPGESVDLKRAWRQRRTLLRDLHPDARGGDESKTEAFNQVTNAYRDLEAYNDQIERNTDDGNSERNVAP